MYNVKMNENYKDLTTYSNKYNISNLYDLDAERVILALILVDPNSFSFVYEKISEAVFYHNDYKIIYRVMCEIYSQGNIIDPVLLSEKLSKFSYVLSNDVEKILEDILSRKFSVFNRLKYILILQDKLNKRKLYNLSEFILKNLNDNIDSNLILKKIEEDMMTIHNQNDDYNKLSDIIQSYSQYKTKDQINNIKYGYKKLDNLTYGLHPGELTIIASRPSVGKTTLAINLMLNWLKNKKTVLFFSIEMSMNQILLKFLSLFSGINFSSIRFNNLLNQEKKIFDQSLLDISKFNLFISDNSNITVFDIERHCREFYFKNNLRVDVIVIDYLQLINMNEKFSANQHIVIGNICRILRHISRSLKIPVVVLSQLNRSAYTFEHSLSMSQLKSSGSIEESADNIFFLNRKLTFKKNIESKNINIDMFSKFNNNYFNKNNNNYSGVNNNSYNQNMQKNNNIEQQKRVILTILKQRNGPLGKINFDFDVCKCKFLEYSDNKV